MRGAGLVAVLLALWGSGAEAQGARSTVNLPQSDGSGNAPGPIAPVGAGTSDAVTTGVSGPETGGSGGEPSLPPLPGPELCESFKDQPAYEPCLETVTSERSVQ